MESWRRAPFVSSYELRVWTWLTFFLGFIGIDINMYMMGLQDCLVTHRDFFVFVKKVTRR